MVRSGTLINNSCPKKHFHEAVVSRTPLLRPFADHCFLDVRGGQMELEGSRLL